MIATMYTIWKGLWRLFVLLVPIVGMCITIERWPWMASIFFLSIVLVLILFLAYLVGCVVEDRLPGYRAGRWD